MRQQIQELEKDWATAMEVISESENTDVVVNPSNPLESDLNGLQGAVDREYQSRCALWSVVKTTGHFEVLNPVSAASRRKLSNIQPHEESSSPSPSPPFSDPDLSTLGLTDPLLGEDSKKAIRPKSASLSFSKGSGPDPEMIPETLARFFSDIASINPPKVSSARDDLSRCVYEQKWCDLICDQLASQVGTQCMEVRMGKNKDRDNSKHYRIPSLSPRPPPRSFPYPLVAAWEAAQILEEALRKLFSDGNQVTL